MSIVKFTNGKFPALNINGTKKLINLPRGPTWQLDIPNLVLSNHTDEYGMSHQFSGSVQKIDDGTQTKLKFGTNTFVYNIDQLSKLGNVKKIEIIVSQLSIGRYAYVGACRATCRRSYDYDKFGPWNAYRYPSGEQWSFKQGSYFSYTNANPYYYIGYQGLDITFPLTIVLEFGETVKQFFNDVLVAEKVNDYASLPASENWYRFGLNSGGDSGTTIVLDSLKVWCK